MGAHVSETRQRLYFVDHLRAVIILLVIVLHTSMTYMAYPPEWWYVIEPENSLAFTGLVLLLDVPNMPALFFIAGFFVYTSLAKAGAARFLFQKVVRIGLPWLTGVVFLAPAVTYLIPLTRGTARPYLQFWLTDFWGPYYQQAVYWFLGFLLLLFGLFAFFINSDPRWQHIERRTVLPTPKLFVQFLAVMILWFFSCSVAIPTDTWSNFLKLLVFQPVRVFIYVGYFALGVYADRNGWLRENGYLPALHNWVPLALGSGIFYLIFRIYWSWGTSLATLLLHAALFNVFCLSALMMGLAVFQRFFNRPSRPWTSLARNTFAIYYVHPLVLYPAAYAALSFQLPIFFEAALLMVLTAILAWGFSALVLTRWPLLRDIF